MVKVSEVLKEQIDVMSHNKKSQQSEIKHLRGAIRFLRHQRRDISLLLGKLKRQTRLAQQENRHGDTSKLAIEINFARETLFEVDAQVKQYQFILSNFYNAGGFEPINARIRVLDVLMEQAKATEAAAEPAVTDSPDQARAVAEAQAAS